MIIERTRHDYIQKLSNEEKAHLEEILEELRVLFNADAVGLEAPELAVGRKTDYTIKIFNSDTIGYTDRAMRTTVIDM